MAKYQEKWQRLRYADLQQVLAQDELDKLDNLSLSSEVSSICETILDNCADAFRGAFRSKSYLIDIRDHYVPKCYHNEVLNIAREQIWSRFPNSKDIAIDDVRKQLYEDAKKTLDNPIRAVPIPDYSDDPELSGRTDLTSNVDGAMTLPLQRIPSLNYDGWYGFPSVYADQMNHFKVFE